MRRRTLILASGGLALAALLALAWVQFSPWPRTGATFTAKQVCSCLFVTGRSEASCRTDFGAYLDRFNIDVDRSGLPATARVTSRLAIFSGEAVYERDFGCRIVK